MNWIVKTFFAQQYAKHLEQEIKSQQMEIEYLEDLLCCQHDGNDLRFTFDEVSSRVNSIANRKRKEKEFKESLKNMI